MASANSMLCTIFLCDGIASFKPHCMSVIQLIDNIVSDSMIDVISHLSIDGNYNKEDHIMGLGATITTC